MIKAVFFDIDGTLLSFDTHKIPHSTIQAISELKEKGIKVFIATGRHKKEIAVLDPLVFDAYISLNGSYCYDKEGKAIYKKPIPEQDMESLIKIQSSDMRFPCFLGTADNMILNFENERVREMYELISLTRKSPVDFDTWSEAARGEVFQLIAFFGPDNEEKIMSYLPGAVATRWVSLFADVIAKGISKRTGIDQVLKHYQIDLSETMAFGDGGNDIEMLRHVGIGVAMGNAADHVRQSADYVTDSVDNDGIIKALKHFKIL